MAQDIDEDRLVHYFAGECTEEEEAKIEAWIQADAARKERARKLRQVWEAANEPVQGNVDAMWGKLSRRMRIPSRNTSGRPGDRLEKLSDRERLRSRSSRGRRRGRGTQSLRTAAFIALVAFLGFLAGEFATSKGETAMREVATAAGERVRVKLGDGTQVMMNAKSTLTLPAQFEGDKRVVELEGEAYFDVAPDGERPFLVQAGGTVTRVLGTQFSVGAYPGEADVEVVVAEGRVAVRPEGKQEQELLLRRRQRGRLSKTGQSVLRQEVDPNRYLAWTQGRLVFHDARFSEVARKLEHWYDLQVRLEGEDASDVDHLNASFKEEPLAEVLGVIAESLQLRYEREGRTVFFSPATPR